MRSNRVAFNENRLADVSKAIIFGVSIGCIICIILFTISSMLFIFSKSLPQNLISYIVIVIMAVCSFFAGYFTAKIYKSNGLLYGAVSGLIIFLIIFFSGSIILQQTATTQTFLKFILSTLMGATGGVVGVNKKVKKRY